MSTSRHCLGAARHECVASSIYAACCSNAPTGAMPRIAENIAEAVQGATPRALQRFLTEATWQHLPVIQALHQFLGPRLSSPDGVFIFDESDAAKQGKHSVGVARQYSGTLGKVGNCQIGVYGFARLCLMP